MPLIRSILVLLATLPVADDMPALPPPDMQIEAPPAPPPCVWHVWGYKLVDNQWVRQPRHCLKTTDLKKAAEYQQEIMRFQNWITRDNLPAACVDGPTQFAFSSSIPLPTEVPPIEFEVWAFHLIDGKWAKDTKYCWVSKSIPNARIDALAYTQKLNAIHGWCATTNAPECAISKTRTRDITYHGPRVKQERGSRGQYALGGGYVHTSDGRTVYDPEFSPGGRTIYGPHATWRIGRDANRNLRTDDDWADRQQQQSMDDFNRQMEFNAMMNQQSQQMQPPIMDNP